MHGTHSLMVSELGLASFRVNNILSNVNNYTCLPNTFYIVCWRSITRIETHTNNFGCSNSPTHFECDPTNLLWPI
jgi:hypothetical protein